MDKNISSQDKLIKKASEKFKDKKIVFAFWRGENKDDSPYQNWYLPLKEIFRNIIVFDTAKAYFRHGKKEMAERLLDLVEKEKPDYVFFSVIYDEFDIFTLQKVKKISPKTKTINLFSDDDWRYGEFSRYYALFFDYSILLHDFSKEYLSEGVRNTIFFIGVNTKMFKPLEIERKYDVTFFGRPNDSRARQIKYLISKGIEVEIWGDGWSKYPELKEHYHGFLPADELVKRINETKINLGFTLGGYGKPQIKGRPFEVSACKSFILVEHHEKYKDFFVENKEIVMFKDDDELVRKIIYYLKNERQREKIAENAYKKILKDYNQNFEMAKFFMKTLEIDKYSTLLDLPEKQEGVAYFSQDDLKLEKKELLKRAKNARYVALNDNATRHSYRDFMQTYALEKTGKNISICDYYVNSKYLGNYMLFKASKAFNTLQEESFLQMLKPGQLVFRKSFFEKNLDKIKDIWDGKAGEILSDENIAFVSVPLISIKESPAASYKSINSSFQMKFLDKLYSLYYQNKLLTSFYPYCLLMRSLFRDKFILRALHENIRDKNKIAKIRKGL